MTEVSTTPRKILLFVPEAVFTPHHAAMLLIGHALRAKGHQVVATFCDRQLPRCIARIREPIGTSSISGSMCEHCVPRAQAALRDFDFPILDLNTLITPAIRAEAEAILVRSDDNPLRFELDGIPLGRLLLHDLILARKLAPGDEEGDDAKLWLREAIATGILALRSVQAATVDHGITDILFYGQYGLNMAILAMAKRQGISVRNVINVSHQGVDRRFLQIQPYEYREFIFDIFDLWRVNQHKPLSFAEINEIGDDIIARLRAQSAHTYSPVKTVGGDIRSRLGIPKGERLIVAYTSSLDEIFAQDMLEQGLGRVRTFSLKNIFQDQMQWLSALVEWAGKRSDVQLVIRIHPREDANRREGARSSHLERLQMLLASLPANVRVVWPRDPVSSYDLLEAADLVLNAWSFIGVEAARLGVPVITAFPLLMCSPVGQLPPGDVTLETYLDAIEQRLGTAATQEGIVEAFRWYWQSVFGGAVSVADIVPSPDYDEMLPPTVAAAADDIARAVFDQLPIQFARAAAPGNIYPATKKDEWAQITQQLRRVIHFIFTGHADNPQAVRIVKDPSAIETIQSAPLGTLVVAGVRCAYRHEGGTSVVDSPLIARLAPLLADADSMPPQIFGMVRQEKPNGRTTAAAVQQERARLVRTLTMAALLPSYLLGKLVSAETTEREALLRLLVQIRGSGRSGSAGSTLTEALINAENAYPGEPKVLVDAFVDMMTAAVDAVDAGEVDGLADVLAPLFDRLASQSDWRFRDLLQVLAALCADVTGNAHPPWGHQAMIRLHCSTRGAFNAVGAAIAARASSSPLAGPFPLKNEFDSTAGTVREAVVTLKADGYWQRPGYLSTDRLERLRRFALDTPMVATPGNLKAPVDLTAPGIVGYTADEQDLICHGDVQALVADPFLWSIAREYLGKQPVFTAARLWWSLPTTVASNDLAQLYHFDMDWVRFLKVFVYLTDVGPAAGPHTYVRGSHRPDGKPKELLRRGYARVTDEEIAAHHSAETIIKAYGAAGSILIGDTLCWHKGEPPLSEPRLLLQLEFSSSVALGPQLPSLVLPDDCAQDLRSAVENFPDLFPTLRLSSEVKHEG